MFRETKTFTSYSVNDLPAAKKFYGETLGLNVVEDTSMPMSLLGVHLANGGEIMMYPKDNHTAASFTVLNFVVDDIDAAVDGLIAKGVAFEHYGEGVKTDEKGIARPGEHSHGEPSIAWFKDPAGNILSVLQEK